MSKLGSKGKSFAAEIVAVVHLKLTNKLAFVGGKR